MTLHDAIKEILQLSKKPMTARAIADDLNISKLYQKKDKSQIKQEQVTARVKNYQTLFDIDYTVSPLQICLRDWKSIVDEGSRKSSTELNTERRVSKNQKLSFEAISNTDARILILGSLPGDKSLEVNEYYGHPRNRFWQILSVITNDILPISYSDKKEFLLRNRIAVWDVAHTAIREGSLDSNILDETPNDLDSFLIKHENLKTIGFNGQKAEALYDKYFSRKNGIDYISLPSSSPANAKLTLEKIASKWGQLLLNHDNLETLLLNGPTATDQQLVTIRQNRKAINQWRTK